MADLERPASDKSARPRRPDDGAPWEAEDGVGAADTRFEVSAAFVARRAVALIAGLSGRRPESVISLEPVEDGWRVGVEVVEVSRIPDSADILAVYEVRLDADGGLISYRRVKRYARGGLLDWERRP